VTRYMLDTNMVSQLIRAQARVLAKVQAVPMAALCLSTVTEGELLFGLAKRPTATRLHAIVREVLQRIDVLPWDRGAADCYGTLRADLERLGLSLAPLDLLIAAHAQSSGAVLVTNDRALAKIPGLVAEDWTV